MRPLIVGFTGTREGMSGYQMRQLREWFVGRSVAEFHHGDCIGADAEAHEFIVGFNAFLSNKISIHIHPPTNNELRAFCGPFTMRYSPQDYSARNRDIVKVSDILIAAPRTRWRQSRGGTWSTIRFAEKIGKSVLILKR